MDDRPTPTTVQQAESVDDAGYLIWALADDWLAEHPPEDGLVESEDVHAWLVQQGRNLGAS